MSQIVDAIDAEIEEAERVLTAAELRVSSLRELREGAIALNGGPPAAAKEKPSAAKPKQRKRAVKAKVSPPVRKSQAPPAEAPAQHERGKRSALAEERHAKVLAFVREHDEIRPAQAADLLGMSETNAATFLRGMVTHGRTPLRRYELEPGNPRKGVTYRLEIAPSNGEGAKTAVEQRVLDAVKAAQPIDEGTLAFHAAISVNDLRSVATGLVRRGVLTCRKEENVKLYEVAR